MNVYQKELYHYGVVGMKWGIRRYQNLDGTLTELGRKRLYKMDPKAHSTRFANDAESEKGDYVLKKGTKVNRVHQLDPTGNYTYDYVTSHQKELEKNARKRENELDRRYVSADGIMQRGVEGKQFYAEWFSDGGWDADKIRIDTYELKKDVRVANGNKVIDAIIKEVGDLPLKHFIGDMAKGKYSDYSDLSISDAKKMGVEFNQTRFDRASSALRERSEIGKEAIRYLTMKYTNDKDLHTKIDQKFIDTGYDAIEDVNDLYSSMPIIMLKSKESMKLVSTEKGVDYFDALKKKMGLV